jgi:hypothetical protein
MKKQLEEVRGGGFFPAWKNFVKNCLSLQHGKLAFFAASSSSSEFTNKPIQQQHREQESY